MKKLRKSTTLKVSDDNKLSIEWELDSFPHADTQRFFELIGILGEIALEKQHDYGTDELPYANLESSSEYGIDPWLASELKANDKTTRIKSFAAKGILKNESLTDSFMDRASYSLIDIVLLEKQLGEELI